MEHLTKLTIAASRNRRYAQMDLIDFEYSDVDGLSELVSDASQGAFHVMQGQP